MSGELEAIVVEVVRGRTMLAPVTLSTLIVEIDERLHEVPQAEELDRAVARVVARGEVRELSDGGLVDGRSSYGSSDHQMISDDSYRTAVVRAPQADAPLEALTQPKLKVTLRHSGDRSRDIEAWQAAERLAVEVCRLLRSRDRPATVRSLRTSPDRIEFVILGRWADNSQSLESIVRPHLREVAGDDGLLEVIPTGPDI